MSSPVGTERDRRVDAGVETGGLFRVLALAGALTLISSYVSVFYFITSVVGGTGDLLIVTAGAFVAGTVAAAYVRERVAAAITAVLLIVGSVVYLSSVPEGLSVLFVATEEIVGDAVALLTGLPIQRIKNPGVWTVGYVPAPLFLSWYLALRRRYVASAAVGGVALGILVLTGDASGRVTLAGTLGGIATIGFGELERYDGTIAQADSLAILFAVMMALSLVVPLVPGGETDPVYLFGSGGGGGDTLEASLTNAPEESRIQGSIRLSPEKRFTVETEDPQYLRVGVYDRFTGGSWLRTGDTRPYGGDLSAPPGQSSEVEQRITAEADVNVMPAAYQPVAVDGEQAGDTQVTDQGALLPGSTLSEGDSYTVTSAVIDPSSDDLRDAGTDYPEGLNDTYLQTGDLSDRFVERTDRITENAENPYETATVIERYLESNKEYSLDVNRPDGNVAQEFLLNMEQGYCVYYATTMVMMLRSEGIPARYATGYLPGTETDEDTYTVRGLDSHAWVEVYFPDEGWVVFDPTPGEPRQEAERQVLAEAAGNGTATTPEPTTTPQAPTTAPDSTTVGTDGTTETSGTTVAGNRTRPPGIGPGPVQGGGVNGTIAGTVPIPNIDEGAAGNGSGPGGGGPSIPPPEDVALGGVLLLGLAAGVHRSGAPDRLWWALQVRWQGPRRSPDLDTERAYRRLEMLLERRYRPRRGEETPRDYVDALALTGADERVERVAHLYELAHYGDGVTDAEAEEAIELVDELVGERSLLPGRLSR